MQRVKERLRKIDYRTVFKYLFYFVAILLLHRSEIRGLAPFAFAFTAALIYLKQNPLALGLMYVFGGYLMTLDYVMFAYTLPAALILITAAMVYKRLGKDIHLLLFALFVAVSQIAYLTYYPVPPAAETIVYRLIEVALMAVFALAFVNGLRAVLVRGLRFKITIDETVSIALLAVALYQSIFAVRLFGVDISLIVGLFLILLASSIFGGGGAAILGAILGLSGLIYNNSVLYIAVFAVLGITSGVFKDMLRVLSALAVMLVYLIFAYYFTVFPAFTYLDIISAAIPCVVYALLPKSFVAWCTDLLGGVSERTLSRYIVNRSRQDIAGRLYELSDVFKEMELMYGKLVSRGVNQDAAAEKMVQDLQCKTCEGCGEQSKCWFKFKDTVSECFHTLVKSGISKGKVTLMDLDPFLTGRCMRVNSLMQTANQLVSVFKQNLIMTSNMDSSKDMISRQMGGVSRIMSSLAQSTKERVVFNLPLEKNLIDELAYHNIVCNEVIIYGDNYENLNVSVVLRESDAYDGNIGELVSKACGLKMMVVSREGSGRQGWAVVYLRPMPKYDVVFGAAGCKKYDSEKSGDTHSLIRIAENKFMLCLCDGMGSGEKAEEISATSISLVENFYRAGFDNEVILNSVNKLLAYVGEEVFAAIDIAVIDLKDGDADFIKIGAPESFVKGKTGAQVIEGSSLPLGILEEITPWLDRRQLVSGDMVILATDGIREGFGGEQPLTEFINGKTVLNPQTLADEIVEEAVLRQEGKPVDDMTVIVCKMFHK